MFRIRRIYDATLPINKKIISDVQDIIRELVPDIDEKRVARISELLTNGARQKFEPTLYVADDSNYHVKGFGIVLHSKELGFSFLDSMGTRREFFGKGIGGAIYGQIREDMIELKSKGIFMECSPDDENCKVSGLLEPNKKRLKFYESFGARPIMNINYKNPDMRSGEDASFLVFDPLVMDAALDAHGLKKFVKSFMDWRYGDVSKEMVRRILDSIEGNEVVLREFRYTAPVQKSAPYQKEKIVLVVNEKHEIHHVKDKGYVESPARVKSVLKEIDKTDFFVRMKAKDFAESWIRRVHDKNYIDFFKKMVKTMKPADSLYPYVFPVRNADRPPKELDVRAGYYCIDTFTPISIDAFNAAKEAVDCALTTAEKILEGKKVAYALVRPPGHHAEKKFFGGFCYFNSNAVAAEFLSEHGKVAILDIDYHHGNGQQDIFYERSDVLTVSIHGHPDFAYPYFAGFKDEEGVGKGKGFNINFPLKEKLAYEEYKVALISALKKVRQFNPDFLIVALGLDIAKKDPTGTWSLETKDFEENGKLIAELGLPTLVVQEGGYNTRTMGKNAVSFLRGLVGA